MTTNRLAWCRRTGGESFVGQDCEDLVGPPAKLPAGPFGRPGQDSQVLNSTPR